MKRLCAAMLLACLSALINTGHAMPPDPTLNADAIRSQIKNPALGDACISDAQGHLCVVTSSYLAGAICAIVWNGKEFVDDAGHGGSLQYALTVDGLGTAYNPTEAGGKPDDYHLRQFDNNHPTDIFLQKTFLLAPPWATVPQAALTSSVLQKFTSTANIIHSEARMAFWLTPKSTIDMWTDAKGVEHPAPAAVNSAVTSNYILKKTVTLSPDDLPKGLSGGRAGVIKLEAEIIVPPLDDEIKKALANPIFGVVGAKAQTEPSIAIEAPTGYLLKDFNKYYEYISPNDGAAAATLKDISKSHAAVSPNDPYETSNPIIFATADDKYAMGVYSFSGQPGSSPASYHTYVTDSAYSPGLSKWNVTYHAPIGQKTTTLKYTTYLVIGSVADVTAGLQALQSHGR